MKFFVPLLLVLGSSMAEMMSKSSSSSMPAQARESTQHVTSTAWDTPSYTSSYYQAPYTAPASTGFGFGGGLEVGFPGLVNTALTVVLSLVGLSMLIQVVTKLADIPFIKNLFSDDARSLNINHAVEMASYAMDSIAKFQEMYQ